VLSWIGAVTNTSDVLPPKQIFLEGEYFAGRELSGAFLGGRELDGEYLAGRSLQGKIDG
jgi:hypothetical protein